MNKSELKKLMEDYCVTESELEDVIWFVQELLERKAKELREMELCATPTIRHLKEAAYEVYSLTDYIENAMEDDE